MEKNYIEIIREKLRKESKCGGTLLNLYTLLVFTRGVQCSLEDVHDAWAIWENNIDPNHKSLIPFDTLTHEVQELDRFYMDAIHKVAKEL